MRTFMLRFVVVLASLVLLGGPALAGSLDEAKAAGLVGETPTGYLAAVEANPAPDIVALVNEVNAKREAAYAQIAADTASSVDQVAAVTAEKLYQQAAPGEFLLVDGQWVRK
jgi:uncharacterized protein YdbL (DUF1318 family)